MAKASKMQPKKASVKDKEKLPVNTPRWSGRTLAGAKKA